MDPRRRLPPPRSGLVRADPCEGRLPARAGETFSGVVRYVGDGDSLCLGPSTDPSTWIEVRLADFDAPEIHSPTGRVDRDRCPDWCGAGSWPAWRFAAATAG